VVIAELSLLVLIALKSVPIIRLSAAATFLALRRIIDRI
jgi:hypothetical protein